MKREIIYQGLFEGTERLEDGALMIEAGEEEMSIP